MWFNAVPMQARAYWPAFGVCALLASLPLFVTGPLPMADLPEHIAQVSIWKHFGDACHRFAATFEIHWSTPYLLGYAIARALAGFMSSAAAVKATVWAAVLLLPLSMRALLRRGGGDPGWSLLGFLLAYGYSFYWGFFNFSLALPLGIFFLALLFDERPRPVAIGALAIVLLGAHALVLLFCIGATVAVAVARRSWRTALPVLPAAVLLAAWTLYMRQVEGSVHMPTVWSITVERLTYLPSALVANAWESAAIPIVLAVALAVAVTRPRVTRDPARWLLAALALVVYFVAPFFAFGTVCLYPRFAVMIVVTALFLFAPARALALSGSIVFLLVAVWMLVLTNRFQRFGDDAARFEEIVDALPAGRRVILLRNDVGSDAVPGPVFSHFAALYQARKGGLVADSFANYYAPIVGYRRGAALTAHDRYSQAGLVHWPSLLEYDYVIARAAERRGLPFSRLPESVRPALRNGAWWVFETPRARRPQRSCGALAGEE